MSSSSGLGKPSLLSKYDQFANVTIAIAHSDPKASLVVKSVLDTLGCKAILLVRDGHELVQLVAKLDIDLAVVDSSLRGMTGVEAVYALRRSASQMRELPVLFIGSFLDTENIAQVRDAGVNEYVRKPFTAKTLLASVHSMVTRPRQFIVCKTYIGPDRRSNPAFSCLPAAPFIGTCRRLGSPKVIRSGEQATSQDSSPALAFYPDGRLKRKMGLECKDLSALDDRKLECLEQVLVTAREIYARSVQEQVRELISYNRLLFQKPEQTADTVAAIRTLAATIEMKATDLGFSRVSEVARLLCEFCMHFFVPGSGRSLILLEKHALTLMALLRAGDDAASRQLGDSLVRDLARQVASFRES